MKKVAVILANGFEEMEAVSTIDIVRRGQIEVAVTSLDNDKLVTSQGNVTIKADYTFDELNFDEFDMIILPGGYGGSMNFVNSEKLIKVIKNFNEKSKFIAAICAAPFALDKAEVLDGEFTCYPGCEGNIKAKGYTSSHKVVKSKNIITSRGPGTAMDFGLEIVKILKGEEIYNNVKSEILL